MHCSHSELLNRSVSICSPPDSAACKQAINWVNCERLACGSYCDCGFYHHYAIKTLPGFRAPRNHNSSVSVQSTINSFTELWIRRCRGRTESWTVLVTSVVLQPPSRDAQADPTHHWIQPHADTRVWSDGLKRENKSRSGIFTHFCRDRKQRDVEVYL